jgi:hypothetical protein
MQLAQLRRIETRIQTRSFAQEHQALHRCMN